VIKFAIKGSSHFYFGNFIFLLAILIALSCSKKNIDEIVEPGGVEPPVIPESYENGIFIVNEGNFNWGNASISFINGKDYLVHNDIYQLANNKNLGDVAESMKIFNNMGFIVVNNSNCIEVVSLKDFKSIKTITGFNSPRNIEIIDSNKAYVTNMVRDIVVVNLKSLTITKTIHFQDWTESMILYNDYLFVTSIGNYVSSNVKRKAKIEIIRTSDDEVVDSITTGKEPLSILIDRKQKIWVLCTGGYDKYEDPSLLRIDPELKLVEKTFLFNKEIDSPSKLCINPSGDTLYYLNNGVYKMAVSDNSLPSQPMIPSDGHLFYGLGVNPGNGNLFVSDAVDYAQNGWVYQFNQSTGNLIKAFRAGRIPGSFCFSGISRTTKKH
jgi:DNA-binding beta-propeller fold protein YncE